METRTLVPPALFHLGYLTATPAAIDALREANASPAALLQRHVTGDPGNLDEHDQAENKLSIEQGFRVLSSYTLSTGVKIYIITEADRSVTTILLPSDY